MLTKSFASLILIASVSALVSAQQQPVGQFDHAADVGNPAKPGSCVYDSERQSYRITASGTNMWTNKDEFHFLWKRMKGNFILRARAEFIGNGVDPHR